MANLNENEIDVIGKFFQNFSASVRKVLTNSLDKEVYPNLDVSVESSSFIEDYDALKKSNAVFRLDYAKGEVTSNITVLIPEEFLANLTDVIMGGKGDETFKGALTELEINASGDLLKKIFKDIENSFRVIYSKDLAFNTNVPLILKESKDYNEFFTRKEYDFVIDYVIKIDDEKEYTVSVLVKTDNLKQTLTSLRLLQDNNSVKNLDMDSINLKHLSDVQIEITAELGRTRVPMKYALELVRGSIIELDTLNNSDIKVFANGVEVAQAQVVVIEDNFGLRLTKIISPEERLKSI